MIDGDNPRVFVPPPLVFGGLLVLGLLIASNPVRSGVTPAIGMALAAGGLALIATAIGLFRKSRTRPEPWQPSSALVTRGLYRFTRNPMYFGMALLSFGIALVFTSLAGAILSIVAAMIIDRAVIRREEAYLTRRFGEDYLAYTRRVRRWF
jgi:protein-S-isoprenylcysteine O-methyltransferase Ste14